MNELRIYDVRPDLLVSIPLDDTGSGEAMVDRTGTAHFFKVCGDFGKTVYGGMVGRDLMLKSRSLVMGSDIITITGMAAAFGELVIKVAVVGDECPECWGTGFTSGWGAPCWRGCTP